MAMPKISRVMCALGIHDAKHTDKWTPSIEANIVTEFEQTHICRRCGKILHHTLLRWNGKEMIDVEL